MQVCAVFNQIWHTESGPAEFALQYTNNTMLDIPLTGAGWVRAGCNLVWRLTFHLPQPQLARSFRALYLQPYSSNTQTAGTVWVGYGLVWRLQFNVTTLE